METNRSSRHGCLWIVVILQAIALVAILVVAAGAAAFSALLSRQDSTPAGGIDEFPPMKEVLSYGRGEAKVVRIPLNGPIFLDESDGFFSTVVSPALRALKSIERARADDEVEAIILEVDSGGGGITASDIIYKALMDFKDSDPDRKIVVLMGDVAASGAYYVSLAADSILAHPTTLTGSIGVLLQSFNLRELGDKIGVKDVTIKSGRNKDLLNPMGEMTDEQRQILQAVVDNMHGRFVAVVARGRNLPEDEVRRLADGRVFSADGAMEAKLIDQIGYWDDAMAKTSELLDGRSLRIYRYEREFSFGMFLRGLGDFNPLAGIPWGSPRTRLLYEWQL